MQSPLFYSSSPVYPQIEAKILSMLNAQPDFLTAHANSPRAVGDAIERIISVNLPTVLTGYCKEFMPDFARRAMADVAFVDTNDYYHNVDVKTHRLNATFSMPNLTSVQRISRLYEDDKNYFTILMVSYALDGNNVHIEKCHFVPIEFLSWKCLTIGALGWGQIQIADANKLIINHGFSRKEWMLQLCDTLLEFYPKEIAKIGERLTYFENLKVTWQNKSES